MKVHGCYEIVEGGVLYVREHKILPHKKKIYI